MTAGVLMLALVQLGHAARTPADLVRARLLATVIVEEAERNDLDPVLVAAVIAHESSFNPHAVGAKGERGLLQLLPGGSALARYQHLAPGALELPRVNVVIGAEHMAHVRDLCRSSDPVEWLSVYAGNKRCRPTKYSRAIVAAAKRARRIIASEERGPAFGAGTAPARAPKEVARQ